MKTMKTTKTTKTSAKRTKTLRVAACATALALALAAAAVAPATALANDGLNPADQIGYQPVAAQASSARVAQHYEGQQVTVGDDWGQPVYAEWHRGDSGAWWATFLTYNGTKVYAQPAQAGCGWSFHAYDKYGDFTTIYRCEESSDHGLYGPKGVSSHWQDDNGNWY